jgi:dienelactone hydrolase
MTGTLTVMDWLGDRFSGQVRERRFDLRHGTKTVPGLLWTPTEPRPDTPLVLLGHGASAHKGTDYVTDLAKALVGRGMAAAAIDGPVHGDRRIDGGRNSQLAFLEFCQAWSSNPAMTDEMVDDWIAVLDGLCALDEFHIPAVGWWGVSMGTIIGLPFVAAEPRVGAAVFGLMGLTGPTRDRIAADAPSIRCPVLFFMQTHDELFDRATSWDLFDAIGATDKRMHVHPGRHGDLPPEAFRESKSFLTSRLLPTLA